LEYSKSSFPKALFLGLPVAMGRETRRGRENIEIEIKSTISSLSKKFAA
jgi:hypothetical protein